ncbi:MAG: asparagine synthase [Clostridia bacterium]|nr:asparagine synthase [Clostridia bacterium]
MKVREGLVPAVLGTVVTATGIALKPVAPFLSWGIAGFGLAHIVLGSIDLVEHRSR